MATTDIIAAATLSAALITSSAAAHGAVAASGTAIPSTASGAMPRAVPLDKRSIDSWVSCSGTSDDTAGVMKAFAAARNDAFTLVVDCPVRLVSGLAVDKSVFIDNGTTVEFTGAGTFFVDNMFHPAFVIANSSDIILSNWNVEWDNSVPVNPDFGGYYLNGQWVVSAGTTQPAQGFNDIVLTNWLAANRGVVFDEKQGWAKSVWVGGVNPAAVFFLTGDSSNVTITGLKIHAPPGAGDHEFIPMVFSSSANWKSNQTVTGETPDTMQYAAVPHLITFSGIELDGIYMGWQGNLQDSVFENITSKRYGDLQNAHGGDVGGIGKWFPPPHLFYIDTHFADPGLNNNHLYFTNVLDEGIRLGVARDKGGSDTMSGYANSIKLGCSACSVDTYTSHRPDGFMGILPSQGLTVSNVIATFDSAFLNDLYPLGLRMPLDIYTNLTFTNVHMTDTAATTVQGPIGNAQSPTNAAFEFTHFTITMNRWEGPGLPPPKITGIEDSSIALTFVMTAQAMSVVSVEKIDVSVILKGTPTTVHPGGATVLSWTSTGADSCAAGGDLVGPIGTSGSQTVTVGAAGTYSYHVHCQNAADSTGATLLVVAAP